MSKNSKFRMKLFYMPHERTRATAGGAQILGHIAKGTVELYKEAYNVVKNGGDVEGLQLNIDMPMTEINNGNVVHTDL